MHLLRAANCGRMHFALSCASRKSPLESIQDALPRFLAFFLIVLSTVRLRKINFKTCILMRSQCSYDNNIFGTGNIGRKLISEIAPRYTRGLFA
jgi:hypothetical protein